MFNIFKRKKLNNKKKTKLVSNIIKTVEAESKKFSTQVDRNLKAKQLEKEGNVK